MWPLNLDSRDQIEQYSMIDKISYPFLLSELSIKFINFYAFTFILYILLMKLGLRSIFVKQTCLFGHSYIFCW